MYQFNRYRLIFISFIDSIVSSAFVIGVLFYLQQTNRDLFANSLVANLGSLAAIVVTLFIGATVDRKSKKRMLILSNVLLALIAWLPGYFYDSKSFFTVLLIVDLVVAVLNLVSNSSIESYLKGTIQEEDLKKTVSFIQLMAMLGLVIGIILMNFAIDYFSAKVFFAGASVFYLFNLIFIVRLSKDVVKVEEGRSSIFNDIKIGLNYINSRKFVRSNVFLTVSLSTTQGFIFSLVIYYWSTIDASFEHITILLSCLGTGLIGGMVLVNLLKNERKITVIVFGLIGSMAMLLMFLCKTPLSLAIVLGTIFGCIQVAGVTLKTQRIKITELYVQGRIGSFNNLFTSILTLMIAIGVSYIGQLIHFSYLPIVILAILNMIFITNYALAYEGKVLNIPQMEQVNEI